MQVTISLLPTTLSLVHIPRSRLSHLSHPILKQVLRPDPTFLNITCNEFELSLFADESVLEEFEPIARKDRLKQRAKSNSSSGRGARSREAEPVEVSCERWCVLQVDSHNDQIDNSGARVNEVSAPLAAAGISILYQSSYMSDFILVKESRLQETMSLLAEAGFDIFSGSGSESANSPINTAYPNLGSSIHDFRPDSVLLTASITRARSSTDPTGTKLDLNSVWDDHQKSSDGPTPPRDKTPRRKSTSPSAGDVHILPSDLACVGLSEELGADHWGLKIVKLVAFPELIPSSAPPPYVPRVPISSPVIRPALFPLLKPASPLFELSPPIFPGQKRCSSPTETDSSASSSEDDGYFSHSPHTQSSLSVVTIASRSQTDLRELSPNVSSPFKRRSRHIIHPFSPMSPISCKPVVAPDPVVPSGSSRVPFFSYTRTAEGSSLTADVYILAALFPPPERHMIICSGELDAADKRLNGSHPLEDLLDGDDDDDESDSEGSILRCLQIDLQRFGLDKYGLVNRFSKVLEQNKINHMYSSTFKTANLLVDKKHARRAQALLCNC